MEKTQLSGLKNNSHHNYEPPKVNNFIDIKENEIDMQSSSDRRDTKEDFQSFKARDTSPDKEDVIVLCNLEEPASIVKVEANKPLNSGLPSIGVLDLKAARKKKKAKMNLNI